MVAKVIFLRSAYNYDVDEASKDAGISCPESMAQQQFREETDINTIVERFGLTGEMPDDFKMPVSGDFTGITDYHSAMNTVRQAEEAFLQIPAGIRAEFNNDPGRLMSFLEDDKNRAKAMELGLVPKPPEVDRTGAPVLREGDPVPPQPPSVKTAT